MTLNLRMYMCLWPRKSCVSADNKMISDSVKPKDVIDLRQQVNVCLNLILGQSSAEFDVQSASYLWERTD